MSAAMLNIRVIQPRMLSQKQAADYVGIGARKFTAACPVAPILMPGGVTMYDVRDLDTWLDQLKHGAMESDDAILRKLL